MPEQHARGDQHVAARAPHHALGDGVDVEHDLRLADVDVAVAHARGHHELAAERPGREVLLRGHALALRGLVLARRRQDLPVLVEHAHDADLGLLRHALEQLREHEVVLQQQRLAGVARELLREDDGALARLVRQRARALVEHDQRDRADRGDQQKARQERELEAQRKDHWREIPFSSVPDVRARPERIARTLAQKARTT